MTGSAAAGGSADPFSVHLPELLDATSFSRAFELAAPLINAALTDSRISSEGVLYVVVAKPGTATEDFDRAVVAEHSFGSAAVLGTDYRSFARAKARLCWRTSRDTRQVQQQAPHLLQAGDTLLWGSACRDGLIVAASGAQPWFDEAFSGIVLELLLALTQARRRVLRAHE